MRSMNFMLVTEGCAPSFELFSSDYDNQYVETICKALKCHWIETVSVIISNTRFLLIVDEEGSLQSNPKVNIPAWVWYSNMDISAPIFGNVAIGKQGFIDGEPDIVGLSEEDIEILKREEDEIKRSLRYRLNYIDPRFLL